VPLEHVSPDQARCEIYNSTLSEAGVLGFEYGYSRDYPEALVLWEAQLATSPTSPGCDHQFISAGRTSGTALGMVLLLPHGYEGQGPEHSSARIERFLQLAAATISRSASHRVRAVFPPLATPALRHWRKPSRLHSQEHVAPSDASFHRRLRRQRFLTFCRYRLTKAKSAA